MHRPLSGPAPSPARMQAIYELVYCHISVLATTHWQAGGRRIILNPAKPYDFLLAPLHGELDASVAGRHVRIAPGAVLLVAAGTLHHGHQVGAVPLEACTLHLDLRDAVGSPLLARLRSPVLAVPPGWTARLPDIHAVPDPALRHRLAGEHVRALLLAQDEPEGLVIPRLGGGRLAPLLGLLEERLAEPLAEADLAAAAGLSPSQLRVIFRREVGCTPHRHLVRLRVRRAGHLIRAGRTVAEAAVAAGFASVRGLRLACRRETGRPPAAWRGGD